MKRFLHLAFLAAAAAPAYSVTLQFRASGLPESSIVERFDPVIYPSGSATWTVPYTGTYYISGCGPGSGGGGGHSTAGGGGGGGAAECVRDWPLTCVAGDVLTITFPAGGIAGVGGATPTAGGTQATPASITGCSISPSLFLHPANTAGQPGTGTIGGAGAGAGNTAGFRGAAGPAAGTNANENTVSVWLGHTVSSTGAGGGTTAAVNGQGRSIVWDRGCMKNSSPSNNEGGAGGSTIFQTPDNSHGCLSYGGEAGQNANTLPTNCYGCGGGGGGGASPGGNGAAGGPAGFIVTH